MAEHRTGRRRRRSALRFWLLSLVLLVLLAAWVGVRGLAAQQHLVQARGALSTAQAALLEQDWRAASDAVGVAGRETAEAERLTSDQVWTLLSAIPYAGASFEAVRDLARSADVLARFVLPETIAAARRLDEPGLQADDGTVDLARVRAVTPIVARNAERLVRMRAALDEPRAPVLREVADAHDAFAGELAALEDVLGSARDTLGLVPALLGADRPRRYFVLVQQPAESRGTGGLPGGFAVVEAVRGRIRLVQQGSNAELRNGPVAVPRGVPAEYASLYGDNGAFDTWQNVNLSPDLPTVSRVVAARWRAQGGVPLDGVVALDAQALSALFAGGPPVRVGDDTVAPERLEQYLAVEQYRDVPAGAAQDVRKEELSQAAAQAVSRLSLPGRGLPTVLRGLIKAVRSGHLRLASDDPVLQPVLRRTGVDGALPSGSAPVAYPVVYNAAGGKLDYFLDRRLDHTGGPCENGRRLTRLHVRLTNRAPGAGLPPYVTTRLTADRVVQSTAGALVLQVYGTRGAVLRRATLDGAVLHDVPEGDLPYLSFAEEAGLPLWYLFLDLPRGQTRSLVLELDEPASAVQARTPDQPLSRPLVVGARLRPCAARS